MKYSEFKRTITQCPFCYGDHNETIIENDRAILTYSLAPYHKHHLLVIPKRHVEKIDDISSEEYEAIDSLIKKGIEILKALGYDNYTILVREGAGSGRSVPHIHYHVIPDIRLGDNDHAGADRLILEADQIAALMSEIKSVL